MKLVYIAGLGHSGTTLTDHLFANHPRILGLGEIAAFLSPAHMRHQQRRWGHCNDFRLCSCGADWSDCAFWGGVYHLCGLESEAPMVDKYRRLFEHVRSLHGDEIVVVDSSKSLETLRMLVDNAPSLGIGPGDLRVIFTVRDVRGFVASTRARGETGPSLLSLYRTFNLWTGSTRNALDMLRKSGLDFTLNLYEYLCQDPEGFVKQQVEALGLAPDGLLDTAHGASHIAMGNKDFLMRNRQRVRYDMRWFIADSILLVYLLHGRARRLNRQLYRLAHDRAQA